MIERGVFFLETLRQLGAQLNMAEDADRILASAGQDLASPYRPANYNLVVA